MTDFLDLPATAFQSGRRLASGRLIDVARAVKAAFDRDPAAPALTFDDRTGAQLDFDLSGTAHEFLDRLTARAKYEAYLAEERRAREAEASTGGAASEGRPASGSAGLEARAADTDAGSAAAAARGRGRPRLGVVAREVTLLPRHWEWLASQPGTASQVLRRLIDEARRADGGRSRDRLAREHAYAFISAVGGNLPGFEEATRALFAGDREKFERETAAWSADVREYADRLAWADG